MGKKKGYKYFNSKKDDKKKKRKKSKDFDVPKFKTVKSTIDRKDAKRAKKIILAPVDIPKEFTKIRSKCNHADKLITPAEFRDMTPAYSAYTPMLDRVIAMYGEEHVHICKDCYDVLVDPDAIHEDAIEEAMVTLYLAANKAVSLRRMKDDEVKAISKLKDDLTDWADVADHVSRADADYASRKGFSSADRGGAKIDLNNVGNDATVY